MKIAIIGVRGVPVQYSGFEVLAEELGSRLVAKNHEVVVYCRSIYMRKHKNNTYKGMRLQTLPATGSKYFESFFHSMLSTFHASMYGKFDTILYLGVGNAPLCLIPRIFGTKSVLNIDGLDWNRSKWNIFGKTYLQVAELLSKYIPSTTLTDTKYMQTYYYGKYNKKIPYISNGYTSADSTKRGILQKYNLKSNKYYIWVGRLSPDNNIYELLDAWKNVNTNKKLVVVGDNYYDNKYKKKLIADNSDSSILFTGFIAHQDVVHLLSKSYAYIETKRSGGSHPSLIDAMGNNCMILANDHTSVKEILSNNGIFYSIKQKEISLIKSLNKLEQMDKLTKQKIQNSIYKNAQKKYNWNSIANKYEILLDQKNIV